MWPFGRQYRRPPVPVPGDVAVEGSDPEPAGLGLPTPVGEGDEPLGTEVGPDAAGVAVSGGRVAVGLAEADVAAGALGGAVAVGFAAAWEGLGVAWLEEGRRAIDPLDEDAANTAAPSATRPRITAIGRSATRLPRGRSSRQLGQKPETGVK
ncbi:MAG TPA: hypothetical protein VF833_03975 [Gaiellaceae bacterium]